MKIASGSTSQWHCVSLRAINQIINIYKWVLFMNAQLVFFILVAQLFSVSTFAAQNCEKKLMQKSLGSKALAYCMALGLTAVSLEGCRSEEERRAEEQRRADEERYDHARQIWYREAQRGPLSEAPPYPRREDYVRESSEGDNNARRSGNIRPYYPSPQRVWY